MPYPDSELCVLECLALLLHNPLFIHFDGIHWGGAVNCIGPVFPFFPNSSWLRWQWCLRPWMSSSPVVILKSLQLCAASVEILSLVFSPCSSNGWWVQPVSPWHRQGWVWSQSWKLISDTVVVNVISHKPYIFNFIKLKVGCCNFCYIWSFSKKAY